jgi:hypothetical protein
MVAARAGLRLEQTFQWPGSPFRWRTHAAEGRLYRKTGTPGQ